MKHLLLSLASLLPTWAFAGTFHVATKGSDTNPGSPAQPFKTIQRAAKVARPGDTVLIHAGTYRDTVAPQNSGEAGRPITFQNYEKDAVIVSGADVVPERTWQLDTKQIFRAAVPMHLGDGNQLFLDGQMMSEAQFPNPSSDLSHPAFLMATTGNYTGEGAKAIGTLHHEALKQVPNYWVGATLHVAVGKIWMSETATVMASGPGWVSFKFHEGEHYRPIAGNPFFLFGKLSELDAPGEWFHNPAAQVLHFRPPGTDSPAKHLVEFKARPYAFDLRGKSNVVVRGLQLFASTIITDAASNHIELDGLDVRYPSHFSTLVRWRTGLADSGIILNGTSNALRNSTIAFSAGNGVSLLGVNNTVSNNIIHDVDYSGGVGAGINTGAGARGATISHNTIFRVGHRMIDIGKLQAGLVEYNDVWGGGIQVTDFGGIYAASTNGTGTRISHNLAHDSDGPSSGAPRDNNSKGIYIDNGGSNYVIDHNAAWNVNVGLIVNTRPDETTSNILVLNNTLSGTKVSYGWPKCQTAQTLIANNIFRTNARPGIGAKATHNLPPNTDPLFVPGTHFELQAGSPARHAGIAHPPYAVDEGGQPPDLGAFPYGVKPWVAGSTLWKPSEHAADVPIPPAPVPAAVH